ncbi:MAG: adenylate cyclase [Verrucomicrobiota bacterium]
MRIKFTANRTMVAALFGAVLAAGVGLLIRETGLWAGLEGNSYNLSHALRGNARALEAVIVYLDEPSYKTLGQPLNAAWDRSLHAKLIDRLTAAGASVIVFDIVFVDPMTDHPGADNRLAEAMEKSGRVILAADNVDQGDGSHIISRPFNLLFTNAADVGSAEMLPDADSVVRLHTPEDQMASLSWAAAAFLKANITQQPGQSDARRWVQYYGQPGWLHGVSYHVALDPAKSADDEFRGKAVFVGGRLLTKLAAERKDEFANPYSFWIPRRIAQREGGYYSAGVEVQATKFLNLIRNDWLRRPSVWMEFSVITIAGFLFGFGLVRLRPFAATAVALAGLVTVGITFHLLFVRGITWFPWLLLTVQIGFAAAWSILFNSVQFYAQKRIMEHTLSLYLSPKLVGKFARNPKLLKPGAEKQVLTFLFTDIEDFTALSQGMDSDALAEFMNRYFQNLVANCIHPADGTVVKYIGDAIFAFWNAPEAQPDHAVRACEAALRLRELDEVKMHGHAVRTRVGIHTGEANVGNFGSMERVDYTALGENVNLASRLEGLNKFVGTDSLISAETRAAVGGSLVTRRVGLFTLKGFSKSVEAFEILGRPDAAERTKSWREPFEQALRNYEEGNFEFATIGFREVLELKPEDGPTKFYLERIEDVTKQPLEGDWTGVTMLREK